VGTIAGIYLELEDYLGFGFLMDIYLKIEVSFCKRMNRDLYEKWAAAFPTRQVIRMLAKR
jgi:hypothetical protein